MRNKLLAAAILLLAALAGCGDDANGASELDWSKAVDYDAAEVGRNLGIAAAAFDGTNGRYQETVLGNFIMDGIAAYARHISGGNIDFALHNDSFMRYNPALNAGELINSDIIGMNGGTDTLFVVMYTCEQVTNIINGFVNSPVNGTWRRNCAVLVSREVSYTIDMSTTPPEAKNIRVQGHALDVTREYRVAVGNFIGDNTTDGRFIPVLDENKKTSYAPITVLQAAAMYVLAKGTIDPAEYPLGRYAGVVPVIP